MSDAFQRHLEEASRIVSTWPLWKRTILGWVHVGVTHTRCNQCNAPVPPSPTTTFCSPGCLSKWTRARTEMEVIEETSGLFGSYHRCQYCGCTLKSGYHEPGCPVREIKPSP